MAKVTINKAKPVSPPPTYTVELSVIEAHALCHLLGNTGDSQKEDIIGLNLYLVKAGITSPYTPEKLALALSGGHKSLYSQLDDALGK